MPKKPAVSKWDVAREAGATVEEATKTITEKPVKELTEKQKWDKECRRKNDETWEATHPEDSKEAKKAAKKAEREAKKANEPAHLPRTVAALQPEEQAAWVAKQIESLNKRLGELSAIRAGTVTA